MRFGMFRWSKFLFHVRWQAYSPSMTCLQGATRVPITLPGSSWTPHSSFSCSLRIIPMCSLILNYSDSRYHQKNFQFGGIGCWWCRTPPNIHHHFDVWWCWVGGVGYHQNTYHQILNRSTCSSTRFRISRMFFYDSLGENTCIGVFFS